MPSQTLVIADVEELNVGYCPKCNEAARLFNLTISLHIDDREDRMRYHQVCRCYRCLRTSAAMLRISVSDVIDTKTKNHRRKINKKAAKRERECAEQIGGRVTPASGAGLIKGDARNSEWMIDDKFTKKGSYSLKDQVVKKVMSDARQSGRKGALRVGLCDGKGSEVAVIRWDDFVEMICERENTTEDNQGS